MSAALESRLLNGRESEKIRNRVLDRMLLRRNEPPPNVLYRIDELAILAGVAIRDAEFDLDKLLRTFKIDIAPSSDVYHWEAWDMMRVWRYSSLVENLRKHWLSMIPDDVLIFDANLDWAVYISHTGEVGLVTWPSR